MLAFHHCVKTWDHAVNRFIVFSEFYRRMFIQAGFAAERILVKPHFVAPDPGESTSAKDYALFAGRLAPEKGVPTLIEACKHFKSIPLKVRGDGPLLPQVRQLSSTASVELLPRLCRPKLVELMKGARFLIWPSEGYYETFGLVAVEAFACGIPVIASGAGVMAEVVSPGRTGLHFEQGNPLDLAAKVQWAWEHPVQMAEMGRAARAEYQAKYTAEHNYNMLMQIYRGVFNPGEAHARV